ALEAGEWVGVEFDDGSSTSLFGEEQRLFVSTEEGLAVFEGDEAVTALSHVIARGRLVARDTKAILQIAIPPDTSLASDVDPASVDAARLFDLGIAAYLLDSSRSDYDMFTLADVYLGIVIPEPSDDEPRGAIAA